MASYSSHFFVLAGFLSFFAEKWNMLRIFSQVLPSSFGHGAEGQPFILWIWRNGKIETSKIIYPTDEGEFVDSENQDAGAVNHGSIWEEDSRSTYRGRFEPWSGVVSVMSPSDKFRQAVPQWIRDRLFEKFQYSDLIEF